MLASGFLWSQQASLAGLRSLSSGGGICDRHAAHLFEIGQFHAMQWFMSNETSCLRKHFYVITAKTAIMQDVKIFKFW